MSLLGALLVPDLVSATERGESARVRELLLRGAKPDVIDGVTGWSALHSSILHCPWLLATLLEYTTAPDEPKVGGGTPLSYVVHELGENPEPMRRQHLFAAIHLLLRAGANPQCGGPDQTAIGLARLYKMPEIEKVLLVQSE